jgi:hypothetical protein
MKKMTVKDANELVGGLSAPAGFAGISVSRMWLT